MRKISGSQVLVADKMSANVLAGTALSTILRTIPVEFRCAVIAADENVGPFTCYGLLKLGTNELSRQWMAVLPDAVYQTGTGGTTGLVAKGWSGAQRVGLTDDDIIYTGELVINEIGSLALTFFSTHAATIIWEALYR